MTILQTDKIDIIGTDKLSGEVILTVIDHLEWNSTESHIQALQDKISAYLSFVESGEMAESYPAGNGRQVVIRIAMQHPPNAAGQEFLNRARDVLSKTGLRLERTRPQDTDQGTVT